MATNITNTTQLSIYQPIKELLKANSVLSSKFKEQNFYEFEPLHKSVSFNGFPYIVISLPSSETDLLTFTHTNTTKSLEGKIILVVEWEARSKVLEYINAIIHTIESAQSTLESSGYYSPKIELQSSIPEIVHEKQVITSEFNLTLMGGVER